MIPKLVALVTALSVGEKVDEMMEDLTVHYPEDVISTMAGLVVGAAVFHEALTEMSAETFLEMYLQYVALVFQ